MSERSLPRLPSAGRTHEGNTGLADDQKDLMRRALLSLGALALLTTTGCMHAQSTTFRIRSDLGTLLNDDAGWAGAQGEAVTVEADRPFRLRMEVEPRAPGAFALQARRNEGAWETLEAHDFPHPLRELDLTFEGVAAGSIPLGWTVRRGGAHGLAVIEERDNALLRASGESGGLVALYAAPWPLPDFTFTARFRQPGGSMHSFALVLDHDDAGNHYRVRFDPVGRLVVSRVTDGREVMLADQPAILTSGTWHEAELELEKGELAITLDEVTFKPAVSIDNAAKGDVGVAVLPEAVVDFAEFTLEGVARTPRVSIVATPAYANDASTTDLLHSSPAPFTAGSGLSLAERTLRWTGGAGRHAEFEWPLVIRRLADGVQVNETGDRFSFRMVDSAGDPVPGGPAAEVRLVVPPAHVGGTFVENPGRIGPWQATNGDLYFIMEPTETDNRFMMMKSSDGGTSWHEADGANRPNTNDLESVDSRRVGDRIHIIHQVTRSVRYHVFRTSDHPTHPDSWGLRDEIAAQDVAVAQTASMAVRADGSIAAFYLADRLHYVVRSPDGQWGVPVEIDPEASYVNAGPQAILDRDDRIHLAYFSDDGSIWYRLLLPDGTLTPRQRLAQGAGTSRAEYGAVLPLAYDLASDTVTIAYRLADGSLWARRIAGASAPTQPALVSDRPVITDAVDSQQPAADIVSGGEGSHVLFVDEETRSIFSTQRQGNGWKEPVLRVDGIRGSWVRGNIIRKPDGARVYGYVYDAGSGGGAGMNRYGEIPIDIE